MKHLFLLGCLCVALGACAPVAIQEGPPVVASASQEPSSSPTSAESDLGSSGSSSQSRALYEEGVIALSDAGSRPSIPGVETLQTEWLRAQELFDRAGEMQPNYCEAKVASGLVDERRRHPEEALQKYHAAARFAPLCGGAFRAEALLLSRRGRLAEATSLIKSTLNKHPEATDLHLALAELSMQSGRSAEAEKEALSVLHADEKNVGAILVLSRVYFAQHKLALAQLAADNARDNAPTSAEAYHQLGLIALERGERSQALSAFKKAVELRPDLYASQLNLSQLLSEAGDFAGALSAAEAAVAYAPESPAARLALGNAYRNAQKLNEAKAEYEKLLASDRKNREAFYNLALLYLDSELPGVELTARLKRAVQLFSDYLTAFKVETDEARTVRGYVDAARKQITSEEKRKERESRRTAKGAASTPAKKPP